MKIPKGMTEAYVLGVIENVASRLAYKFMFGYHRPEDMKQQIKIEAIKAMERYDPSRPLENFLYVHCHNRTYNFKRDNYVGAPNKCTCEDVCDKCRVKHERIESRRNLISPVSFAVIGDMERADTNTQVEIEELKQNIHNSIHVLYRRLWLLFIYDRVTEEQMERLSVGIKEAINGKV